MKHRLTTRKFALPKQSSVDSLTELFRAAVSQKGSVQQVMFTVDPPELSVELYVESDELLAGEVPGGTPENLWQALTTVDMEEIDPGAARLNKEASALLTTLMLKAAAKKVAGVAWAVGDVKMFLRWLGLGVKSELPDTFWNLPLIELEELQDSALVLMCAKSGKLGALKAEVGFLTYMKEAGDVGSGE